MHWAEMNRINPDHYIYNDIIGANYVYYITKKLTKVWIILSVFIQSAKKHNVKYDWKFKDVKGKSTSYFKLDIDWDGYEKLSNDVKVELNGINRQFNVDFKYSGRNWTPIIESAMDDNF